MKQPTKILAQLLLQSLNHIHSCSCLLLPSLSQPHLPSLTSLTHLHNNSSFLYSVSHSFNLIRSLRHCFCHPAAHSLTHNLNQPPPQCVLNALLYSLNCTLNHHSLAMSHLCSLINKNRLITPWHSNFFTHSLHWPHLIVSLSLIYPYFSHQFIKYLTHSYSLTHPFILALNQPCLCHFIPSPKWGFKNETLHYDKCH